MTMPSFPAYNPNSAPGSRRHKAAVDVMRRLVASLPADFASDEQFAQLPDSVTPGTIDVEGYAPNVPGVLPAIPAAPPLSAAVPLAATQYPINGGQGAQLPAVPLSHVDQFMQGRTFPTRKPINADPSLFPFEAPAVPDALPDVPVRDTRDEAHRTLIGSGIAALAAQLLGGNAADALVGYAGGAGQANEGLARERQVNYENLVRATQGQNDRAQAQVTRNNSLQEKRYDDALALDRLNEQGYNNEIDSYDKRLGYAERADNVDANNKQKASTEQSERERRFFQYADRTNANIGDLAPEAQTQQVKLMNAQAAKLGITDPTTGQVWNQPVPGENGTPYYNRSAKGANQDASAAYKGVMAEQAPERTKAMMLGATSGADYKQVLGRQGDRRLDQSEKRDEVNAAQGWARIAQGNQRLSLEEQRVKNAIDKTVGKGADTGKIQAKKFAVDTALNQLRQKRAQEVKLRNDRIKSRTWTDAQQTAFDNQDRSYQDTIYNAQNYSDSLGQQIGQMRSYPVPTNDPNRTSFTAPTTFAPSGSGYTQQAYNNGTNPPSASRSTLPAVPRNAPPPTQHHSVSQPRTTTGQFNGPPASTSYDPKKLSTADLVRKFGALATKKYGKK